MTVLFYKQGRLQQLELHSLALGDALCVRARVDGGLPEVICGAQQDGGVPAGGRAAGRRATPRPYLPSQTQRH